MVSQRNCVIGSIVAIVIIVGGGVGIYFATKGKSESNDNNNSTVTSTDKLLVKSNDGTIRLYDRSANNFVEVKAEIKDFGITSFGQYLDKTIYYATNEPKSVIHSTNATYPDLPNFTADWVKTAIDVDDVTHKVYVVDRLAKQIKVVEEDLQYVLPLTLNEPTDVILVPENSTMFILNRVDETKAEIIKADMDGSNPKQILTHGNLQALAVDGKNGFLYFAHQEGIESFDYKNKEGKRLVLNKDIKDVQSLAYCNMTLYFVNKKGKSSKNQGTSLDVCDLTNSKCVNQCCDVQTVYANDQLDQVKMPKGAKVEAKNPCEKDNGNCGQFCLLNTSTEGYSCQCGVGWKLKADKKACEKA